MGTMLCFYYCEKGRLLSGLRGSSGGVAGSKVAEGEDQQRVAEVRRYQRVAHWLGIVVVALSHSSRIGCTVGGWLWRNEGGVLARKQLRR